ncbi:unnamed protein product [Heterotrigona itama]|uniref:Uncharacterized protein n=1 Tax=Heterotrigona itama TaxID=395501 RepID=A0A6V7HCY7_9HYME|nr:unnamed protein product [Heterotrigona itama]
MLKHPRLAFDDTSRRCKGNERERPVIYTNFLLRCLVDSIAVCARDSPAITSITVDGIPLTLKYLNILCSGLRSNEKLTSLSLTRCHIGDVGCDLLLGSLRNNPKLCVLNLSSCWLSDRSAMNLSLFLKRRKADLLQNVWEQSSVQSRDENSDKKVQGLQTLILNQNPKLGDTGLKQLIYALKSDVWLRSLSLRHCGISKHGAEMMIRLLQSNTRITRLDLTENRIPINTLQMILRILKRRREVVESMKTRLCMDLRRGMLNKNGIHGFPQKHGKSLQNKTERLKKYSARRHRWKKIQRFDKGMRQSKEIEVSKEDQSRMKKLGNLESQLSSLVESNFKLKEELSSNKALLDAEARQRSRMEDELQKVSLRLNDLKSKVVMLNCVSSTACNESHLLKGLRYIFEKLESSFSIAAQKDEEAVLNNAEPLWSSPLAHQMEDNFVNCLQRSNVALFSAENIAICRISPRTMGLDQFQFQPPLQRIEWEPFISAGQNRVTSTPPSRNKHSERQVEMLSKHDPMAKPINVGWSNIVFVDSRFSPVSAHSRPLLYPRNQPKRHSGPGIMCNGGSPDDKNPYVGLCGSVSCTN